ncbi:hypothetical protein BDK51DRAFT_39435 [Blyttiomyces helicus]|uniref:Uncharacterized protein n=1 Tax=Blyttiomyces helicus TaxID=388810 RepID=A0A4P9WRC5_9FUNG|nr:hypothetical protein BDK51DRAFT_39435 [Blyttiomyces helicus]|eukprot:RKO93800.1 hypothetical protein BDK51DRAFT_39435 [Blyttiomyces helicus]
MWSTIAESPSLASASRRKNDLANAAPRLVGIDWRVSHSHPHAPHRLTPLSVRLACHPSVIQSIPSFPFPTLLELGPSTPRSPSRQVSSFSPAPVGNTLSPRLACLPQSNNTMSCEDEFVFVAAPPCSSTIYPILDDVPSPGAETVDHVEGAAPSADAEPAELLMTPELPSSDSSDLPPFAEDKAEDEPAKKAEAKTDDVLSDADLSPKWLFLAESDAPPCYAPDPALLGPAPIVIDDDNWEDHVLTWLILTLSLVLMVLIGTLLGPVVVSSIAASHGDTGVLPPSTGPLLASPAVSPAAAIKNDYVTTTTWDAASVTSSAVDPAAPTSSVQRPPPVDDAENPTESAGSDTWLSTIPEMATLAAAIAGEHADSLIAGIALINDGIRDSFAAIADEMETARVAVVDALLRLRDDVVEAGGKLGVWVDSAIDRLRRSLPFEGRAAAEESVVDDARDEVLAAESVFDQDGGFGKHGWERVTGLFWG